MKPEAPHPAERHSERSMAKAPKRVLLALRRKPWRSAVPVTSDTGKRDQVQSKTPQDGKVDTRENKQPKQLYHEGQASF